MNKKIIIGDFSGIQNYLFNIQKNKSATKRLKGRSVFIEMLLEKIKEDLKDFGVGNFEELLTSGGKFILICENFDKGKFNEFKEKIEKKLFKQFYGELKIIFGVSDLDENNFEINLAKAYEDVEKNKLKAFQNILIDSEIYTRVPSLEQVQFTMSSEGQKKWNEEMFIFNDDRGPQKVCKFSRGDLIKIKKGFDGYIDDILEEENLDGIGLNTANDIIISNFIADNQGGKNKIKFFNEEELKIDEKYKKYLPKNTDGKIKSFEELVKGGNFNKLAVLKGDIDNLGETFQFGLKDSETSSEGHTYRENYEKLSKILDDFWKEELYKLIGKKDIYVVYAGGDDFVILGKWDVIIEFYRDLLKEFESKVAKNNKVIELLKDEYLEEDSETSSEGQNLEGQKKAKIHFSGAINLFAPHDTFFTIVKQTESLLEQAKDGDKNQVNIFGQVLKNDEFISIFDEAKEFYKKFVNTENGVSTGSLRFLLDTAKKIKIENNDGKDEDKKEVNPEEYIMWRPHLFYHLARNYKKDEFRKYIDGMILGNEVKEFKSLSGNDELFDENTGEKLVVMMSYILYKKRDKG